MEIPQHVQDFWNRFLASTACPPDANNLFLESFQIGSTPSEADYGLREILSGIKTATSSPLWQYENSGEPIPRRGSLSVVEDGNKQPRCVIRTNWVEIKHISDIDASFARDYGETDGTVQGWHTAFDEYYAGVCAQMDRAFNDQFPLVCERFEVLFADQES